jgi:hypothetical protein
VPERLGGEVELWDGWSLTLPNDCLAERNRDGSWSAWDVAHTIDVHIVTVTGSADGQDVEATAILGREPNTQGTRWIGHVEELQEADEDGDAYRLAITAAARNTLMSCWVAYRGDNDRRWASEVLRSIEFTPFGSE